jgi:HD superfamily phosphohydrolase YqeK
MSKELFLD